MKEDYTFNMATLRQVQYQEKHHPRRKKFINRNRRIVDLMDRHVNGLLTLNDYFFKISKTIVKKNFQWISMLVIAKFRHDHCVKFFHIKVFQYI